MTILEMADLFVEISGLQEIGGLEPMSLPMSHETEQETSPAKHPLSRTSWMEVA